MVVCVHFVWLHVQSDCLFTHAFSTISCMHYWKSVHTHLSVPPSLPHSLPPLFSLMLIAVRAFQTSKCHSSQLSKMERDFEAHTSVTSRWGFIQIPLQDPDIPVLTLPIHICPIILCYCSMMTGQFTQFKTLSHLSLVGNHVDSFDCILKGLPTSYPTGQQQHFCVPDVAKVWKKMFINI